MGLFPEILPYKEALPLPEDVPPLVGLIYAQLLVGLIYAQLLIGLIYAQLLIGWSYLCSAIGWDSFVSGLSISFIDWSLFCMPLASRSFN